MYMWGLLCTGSLRFGTPGELFVDVKNYIIAWNIKIRTYLQSLCPVFQIIMKISKQTRADICPLTTKQRKNIH